MQLLAANVAAVMHFEIFIEQCPFAASRAATAPSAQKGGFEWAIYRHYGLLYLLSLSSAARVMTLGQTATIIFLIFSDGK